MAAAPLAVLGAGLVSGVGLNAAQCSAAIRCGTNNFQETRFVGSNGEWLVGSAVELEQPWRGTSRLAKIAAPAIAECFQEEAGDAIPVLLCVAEPERPGRPANLRHVLHDIEAELGMRLHPHSQLVEQGRVGGAVALLQARRMLTEGHHARVIVAGVDSFLVGATVDAYARQDRLLTRGNSNGFIPGEAAGAILLSAQQDAAAPLLVCGLGFAREPSPFNSGRPLRADGLVQALRAALDEAGIRLHDCDHRVADANGEHYRFKEASLAVARLLRRRKVMFSLWHLADAIGEVGAATLPAMLAVLSSGAQGDYLPGQVCLGHLGNDDDRRAAFVTKATMPQTLALEAASEVAFTLRRREAV
jgi:3-oxoacyl-[acyl-carrier-protein] synthase I